MKAEPIQFKTCYVVTGHDGESIQVNETTSDVNGALAILERHDNPLTLAPLYGTKTPRLMPIDEPIDTLTRAAQSLVADLKQPVRWALRLERVDPARDCQPYGPRQERRGTIRYTSKI